MIAREKQRFLRDISDIYAFDGIAHDSIVFDIGLFKGVWANKIIQKYDPYFYGFEPIKRYFLQAKATLGVSPKVRLFNFGLGRESGQVEFAIKSDKSRPVRENESYEPDRVESVEIKSIDKFMSDIDFVDLACINIEGSEYDLLEGMIESGLISKFGQLLIQFHETQHCPTRDAIREKLNLTHGMVYSYDTVWDLWQKRK